MHSNKYTVELILRNSTLDDILDQWLATGREYNGEGSFVFEGADSVFMEDGLVYIQMGLTHYTYNVADFYRIKTTLHE